MPRVSLCVVTARPGGIDVLLIGLTQQSFTDFEVLLVDALWDRRHELVMDAFSDAKILVHHVPPRRRVFPVDACPDARNTAIAKARGELLIWMVDFTVLPSQCLREHWGVWELSRGMVAGMGAHRYVVPPAPAYPLPEYAPCKMFTPNAVAGVTYEYDELASRAFAKDIEDGFYDPFMYSIFKDPIISQDQVITMPEDPLFCGVDPKLHGNVGGTLSGNFFHAKNESLPLAAAVAVNGFDESYIGHLYDDVDFGYRVEHKGAAWRLLHPSTTVQIVNPRHFFPHLVRLAPTEAQRALYDSRRSDPRAVRSSNPYTLQTMREMGGWWY